MELRNASSALDTQIRDTLTSLANTRKDIVNTQTTTFPAKPNYPILYDELLSYARRISKTTMPPAATINASIPTQPPSVVQTPMPDSQAGMTPAAITPSQTQSPAGMNGLVTEPATQQTGNTSLPEGMAQYLNPLSGQLFVPWPLEDKIRSGSLAANQLLMEQGIDPKGYDPALEEERKQKEEAERKEREEREQREREEKERQLLEEREKARQERERQREKEQEEWRRASAAGVGAEAPGSARPGAAGGEKKQFQFTNLDDLDDDDDDDDE